MKLNPKLHPKLIENVRQPISTAELERRWAETRKAMKKQGIDCLVMQNSNQYLGGYVRWFTDIPAKEGYPATVIFPVDDEMTMISCGGVPMPPVPYEWAVRGMKERINRPYFRTLNYTDTMDGEEVIGQLKARGAKRVGIVAKGSMSAATYEYIRENRGKIELVDGSDLVDPIKGGEEPGRAGAHQEDCGDPGCGNGCHACDRETRQERVRDHIGCHAPAHGFG